MATPIDRPDELKKALTRLRMNRNQFADALRKNGINVTSQAVWKWLTGKTASVPGYIGFFLKERYNIHKDSLDS